MTAAIAGGSTYAILKVTGRDDAMHTAEGKARFVGFLLGGLVLSTGAMFKEALESSR